MSQHDFSIANQTASNARADINNALQALATNNSGNAAPSTPYANMWWYEDDTNLLKQRNETNTAWMNVAYLDGSEWSVLDNTKVKTTSGTQTGLLGGQTNATWNAGTGATESLISPANIKSAILNLGADFSTSNKYFNHISGFQVRWGTISSVSDDDETFSNAFSTPFSTACLSCVVGGEALVKTLTTSGFTINRENGYNGTIVFNFIAVGH